MRNKDIQEYDYLKGLLNPEKRQNVKIPSNVPMTSCLFQLKSSFELRVGSSGKLLFFMNPFFLASQSDIGKTFFFDYDGMFVEGFYHKYFTSSWYTIPRASSSPEDLCETVDVGQTIPDLYQSYRLVSGSLKVRYTGTYKETSGVLGGAIIEDCSNNLGSLWYMKTRPDQEYDPDPYSYYNMYRFTGKNISIENAQIAYNKIETTCISGIRLLYYPLDNSFLEFFPIFNVNKAKVEVVMYNPVINASNSVYKPGFNWVVYVTNCLNNARFRFDLCLNFEAIPKPKYLEYIEMSPNNVKIDTIIQKNIIEEVRNKAIQSYI